MAACKAVIISCLLLSRSSNEIPLTGDDEENLVRITGNRFALGLGEKSTVGTSEGNRVGLPLGERD